MCTKAFALVLVGAGDPDDGHVPARHYPGDRDHPDLITAGCCYLHRRSLAYLHTSSLLSAIAAVKKNLYGKACRKRYCRRTVQAVSSPATTMAVGDRYGRHY